MNRTILMISAFLLVAMSCKKEQNDSSLKSKLVYKNWKSTKFINDGVNQDKWCWKNSIYNFYEDGSLYITEGDNEGACAGSIIGRIRKYKYNISADEKMLIVKFNPSIANEVDTFMIKSITDTKFNTKRIVNKNTPPQNVWEDEFTVTP